MTQMQQDFADAATEDDLKIAVHASSIRLIEGYSSSGIPGLQTLFSMEVGHLASLPPREVEAWIDREMPDPVSAGDRNAHDAEMRSTARLRCILQLALLTSAGRAVLKFAFLAIAKKYLPPQVAGLHSPLYRCVPSTLTSAKYAPTLIDVLVTTLGEFGCAGLQSPAAELFKLVAHHISCTIVDNINAYQGSIVRACANGYIRATLNVDVRNIELLLATYCDNPIARAVCVDVVSRQAWERCIAVLAEGDPPQPTVRPFLLPPVTGMGRQSAQRLCGSVAWHFSAMLLRRCVEQEVAARLEVASLSRFFAQLSPGGR